MDFYSNRSWMRRRKSSGQICATTEFRTGCEVFLDYAYSNKECVNVQNKIRCPCLKCKNVNYADRDLVAYHLLVNGFMKNYEKCRWAHGQKKESVIARVYNPDNSTYRMNEMVHDIAGPNFDWERDKEELMNSDANAFFKLLEEGSEPLWPGCTKQTTLSAVATLLNIKVDHNMSHECFESLLKAIKSMLPNGEKLPDSYYFCKKMVKKLGLGYQKIDACHRLPIDQELWERASIVKKNFVKGQGQRRRPSITASASSCTQSSHASYNPTAHNDADCVRVICRDPALLRELQEHLKALTPNELSDAVATAARQQDQSSAEHDEDRTS